MIFNSWYKNLEDILFHGKLFSGSRQVNENGNFISKTITCHSDFEYCNEHIQSMAPLIESLQREGKEDGNETYRS